MKSPQKTSILFVGNSYTYYNNLPGLLEYFVKSSGAGNLKTKMIAPGGSTLKMSWENGKAPNAIRQGNWSHVVLQEQGRLGGTNINGVLKVGEGKEFLDYASRFNAEIKKINAKTVFYAIGIMRNSAANQRKSNSVYAKVAKKLKGTLIPVGLAYEAIAKKKPTLILHEKDGYHPNPAGTYLAACVFYAVLFGKNPIGLPARCFKSTNQKIAKNAKMINLPEKDARLLQAIAWEIVQSIHA